MKKMFACAIIASLLMLPTTQAHAQQAAPTLREITTPGPTANVLTDGQFLLYRAREGDDMSHMSLYAASITGGDPILLETGLSYDLAFDRSFSIDGGIAVWAVQKQDGVHFSARDLRSGASFAISTAPKMGGAPKIQGGRVVWGEQRDDGAHVLTRTFTSGQVTEIDSGAQLLSGPIIWGDYAAWVMDRGTTRQIMRRNLRTMDAPQVIAALDYPTAEIVQLSDNSIVWRDYTPLKSTHDTSPHPSKIMAYTFASNQSQPFQDAIGGVPSSYALAPNVGADTLVLYSESKGPSTLNLATGQRRSLPTPENTTFLWNSDRYVLYEVRTDKADGSSDYDIYGYDIQSDASFPIATGGINIKPSFSSGMLAYQHGAGDSIQVRAIQIARAMPAEQSVYFPQTGHTLSGSFRSFWERSGGLATFGYPLTEEYAERNADTGQVYTVQIFERQRFELHPENAGTPYEVLIGRMGAADAQRRNLIANVAFLPTERPADPGCLWFSETAHSICGSQLRYWRSAGVNLDDPGISQRESLALYGLPLSQPFADPQLGRTVQIFERARFEEFPENPEPYSIQFGRLGAEAAGL